MTRLRAAAVLLTTLLAVSGCASSGSAQRGNAELLSVDVPAASGVVDPTPLARAEQAFALDLLRAEPGTTNLTVSPASLAIALAMLEHGARGRTLRELRTVLHTASQSPDAQGAGWRALLAGWAADHTTRIESADAFWAQRGLPVRHAFLVALARYYRTGVWATDFAHDPGGANQAIDEWTAQHTADRIRHLFQPGDINSRTRIVLADAVYFLAHWQVPFDHSDTAPGDFVRADKTAVQASFISGARTLPCASTPGYQAAELPYLGGRFAALVVMPRAGSLTDFVDGLTQPALSRIVSSLRVDEAQLELPRFETTATLDLVSTLRHLGVHAAFTPAADLSGIAPRLRVTGVVQRTFLKVDEKGTEAAAATGIGGGAGAAAPPQRTIRFDHPFLFLVRDTKTGAILFASRIADPSS